MKLDSQPELKLSPRLLALANLIPQGALPADIGTDHAHIPIYLIQNHRAAHAIASDIHAGPIARAQENIAAHGLSDAIETRFGAGLDAVRAHECDSIVIAGMSGQTIAGILQAAPWTAQGNHTLYLQPMTGAPALRQFLMENGYRIESERAVREDRRYYIILTAQGSPDSPQQNGGMHYRPQNLVSDENAEAYLRGLLTREEKHLAHMEHAVTLDADKIKKQQMIVAEIKEALEEYHANSTKHT